MPAIPSHWTARWIWSADAADKPNRYILFRKTFRNPAPRGDAAWLHITAGHFYHVYFNGALLGRGPDRSYFRQKMFHSYDLQRRLKPGLNTIAVQCHFLGHDSTTCMSRHAAGPAGLLVQVEVGDQIVEQTDDTWRVLPNPAYATDTPPPTFHRPWREEFFADREPRRWQAREFRDADWPRASIVAPAKGGPWTRLVPKETPELTAEPLAPWAMHVERPSGLRTETPEIEQSRPFAVIDPRAPRSAQALRVCTRRQPVQRLLFDLGRAVAGYPRLDIAACQGGTIEILYGDTLSLTPWDMIHLGGRPLVWTPFTARGGRYFRLDITGAANPVSFRSIRWIQTNYPVRRRARFQSADERLNRIWDLCVCSAETCGMEHLVDCVGREQVLWMMDFRFQAPQHAAYFGDTALACKCFRQFAALQLPNGHLLNYGPSAPPIEDLLGDPPPAGIRAREWFGFNFYFILAVLEHYRFSADKSFLEEMLPVCRRSLQYYAKNERGGFAHLGEVSGVYFVDWGYPGAINDPDQVFSFTQALYFGALDAYAQLCAAAGLAAEAQRVSRRAEALEASFHEAFVDPRSGRIADALDGRRRIELNTTHPYTAAARFLNRIPPRLLPVWLEAIRDPRRLRAGSGIGNTLAAEALLRHGRHDEALRHIREYWGSMVDEGLPQTPEFYDLRLPLGTRHRTLAGSMCHSYASMAGVLLQRILLGATVEGSRVRISPWFGALASARGTVPTPRGEVRIAWTRRVRGAVRLDVRAPEGVDIDFQPADPAVDVDLHLSR